MNCTKKFLALLMVLAMALGMTAVAESPAASPVASPVAGEVEPLSTAFLMYADANWKYQWWHDALSRRRA